MIAAARARDARIQKPAIDWCTVPGGRFTLGSLESPDEQPLAEVELAPYRIGRTPVTNAEFEPFILDRGYDRQELWDPIGWELRTRAGFVRPNYWTDPSWNAPDSPVTGVSYWEAEAYARWFGASLPSEAQWEYAAKGPEARLYPWGDLPPTLEHATFSPECQPLERRGTSVHAHPLNVSPFGCVDMAGNLAEWCLDATRPNYLNQPEGLDPVFRADPRAARIVRGGSGLHDASYLRTTSRDYYVPELRDNLIGFRLVLGG